MGKTSRAGNSSNLYATELIITKRNHMKPILQNRSTESSSNFTKFYVILSYAVQLYALNGFLMHKFIQHGVLSMNILTILRARFIEEFPEISSDELELRVNYAYELIKHIRK